MIAKLILPGICLILNVPVFADAADDCISHFQTMKDLYDTSSADSELSCIRTGNTLKFYATAKPPSACEGEDEWHLEAKAIGGKTGKCRLRLHGSPGVACGADRIEFDLAANEAAAWRKFLNRQCD